MTKKKVYGIWWKRGGDYLMGLLSVVMMTDCGIYEHVYYKLPHLYYSTIMCLMSLIVFYWIYTPVTHTTHTVHTRIHSMTNTI